jgi:uncharacterized iron-regulated membrane protein
MTRRHNVHRWYLVHKWTSLVCTAFLLLICLTGLPLVFSEEIDAWLEPHTYASLPADAPRADLDRLTGAGRRMFPREVVTNLFVDDDEPQVYVWMAPSFDALDRDRSVAHFIRFDARTGDVLEVSKPAGQQPARFLSVMLSLHRDLFAKLPGELFLGLMAVLFVIALVSGAVLYTPFMRKIDFGTIRRERSARLRWLDWHNLLGIVTLAWMLVVGATGVMNELTTPLFALWQRTDVEAALAPWRNKPAPLQAELRPVQSALETAQRAAPGTTFTGIMFPGNRFGTPHHYLLWGHGNTHLTSRLFTPLLVDARTDALSAVPPMPWYLRALEVSRPLHFGDYGGLPLKILWTLFDAITIAVLATGLYLWIARRKTQDQRLKRLIVAHERPAETSADRIGSRGTEKSPS